MHPLFRVAISIKTMMSTVKRAQICGLVILLVISFWMTGSQLTKSSGTNDPGTEDLILQQQQQAAAGSEYSSCSAADATNTWNTT